MYTEEKDERIRGKDVNVGGNRTPETKRRKVMGWLKSNQMKAR